MADPWLEWFGNLNLLLFFVGLVGASVLAGVPIAIAFAVGTFAYMVLTTDVPMLLFVGRFYEGMSHLILLAVPLFVFLGLLIEMTGMARSMVDFLASLLGHVRGGLSYVLVGAMYLVSGISGSKAADMAAVAPALFPEMIKRGAEPGDLVALLSATGAQTETVPPSLVLITIGSVTGVSIAALFTGGLLPSIVLAVGLCVVVRRRYRNQDMSGIRRATLAQVARAFIVSLPALALPFVIRFMVVEGVATATEVSTIGIAYTIVIGLLVYRQFDWSRMVPMLVETASLSGAILLILGAATSMAWALTQSGFSQQLADAIAGLPGGKFTFMAVSIVAFVVLGSVLEGIPVIVLFGPLLFPIAREDGHPRDPLRDGDGTGDGHRPVRAAVRRGLLRRRGDRPGRSQPGDPADHGLSAGDADRPGRGGGGAVDFDRVPVTSRTRRRIELGDIDRDPRWIETNAANIGHLRHDDLALPPMVDDLAAAGTDNQIVLDAGYPKIPGKLVPGNDRLGGR